MLRSLSLMVRRLALAVVVGAGLAIAGGPASAATDVIQQIELSDKKIESFIAAQKDMAKVAEKMQGSTSDKPDPSHQKELDAVAVKHGFKDFAEFDDVAANVLMIMAGIDPANGQFTDPVEAIKREIVEVTADKTIKEADKKQMLEELNEALKVTQPIKFQANVDLVKKYREKIEAVLQ